MKKHYKIPQEFCPKCDSENIANEDAEHDGILEVSCHDCSNQWSEDFESPGLINFENREEIFVAEKRLNIYGKPCVIIYNGETECEEEWVKVDCHNDKEFRKNYPNKFGYIIDGEYYIQRV